MCKFLTIFTRLELTAIGELWITCTGTGVSTGGRAHSSPFFRSTDQGVPHVCASFPHENGWMCARPTTDRDLESQRHEKVNASICARPTTDRDRVSVILGQREEGESEKEKNCNCRTYFFE